MSPAERPNIFEYSNYRSLLKDLYGFLKREKKIVTYRWLSKKGGFTSPNFLKLVMDGERNLSEESIPKAALAFGLFRNEISFFKTLVLYTQADNNEDKERYARKLANHKRVTETLPLKGDQFNYYSNPLNLIIRELMTLADPPKKIQEIQCQLINHHKEDEILQSLNLLERLELIVKNKVEPGWAPTSNSVWSGDEVFSQAVTSYHLHMISEASKSIQKFKPAQRDISSVTAGISIANIAKFKKLLQNFRQELTHLSDEDPSREVVYQINMQFFPLTRQSGEPKK